MARSRKKKPRLPKRLIEELTAAEVRKIRRKYAKGDVTQRELGEQHGLSTHQVGLLVRGKRRREDGGPIVATDRRLSLTPDQVAAIRRTYASGSMNQKALAEKYGVRAATISRIVHGRARTDVAGPTIGLGVMPTSRKLTPGQVLEIAQSDESNGELARRFGVTRGSVDAVRKRWGPRIRRAKKKRRR